MKRLFASIHDVSPRFEGEVDRLLDHLAPHVGRRLAMLVVPDHWSSAPITPAFTVRRYSVTRSTRRIAKPQLCAMSVALDAQGDTVPRRGATTIKSPTPPCWSRSTTSVSCARLTPARPWPCWAGLSRWTRPRRGCSTRTPHPRQPPRKSRCGASSACTARRSRRPRRPIGATGARACCPGV